MNNDIDTNVEFIPKVMTGLTGMTCAMCKKSIKKKDVVLAYRYRTFAKTGFPIERIHGFHKMCISMTLDADNILEDNYDIMKASIKEGTFLK